MIGICCDRVKSTERTAAADRNSSTCKSTEVQEPQVALYQFNTAIIVAVEEKNALPSAGSPISNALRKDIEDFENSSGSGGSGGGRGD